MILKPGREAEAEAIFRKWELDFAVIGHLTDTGRIVIRHKGEVEADIPLAPLESEAPLYRRPTAETPKQPVLDAADRARPGRHRRGAGDAGRLPRPLLPPLDLGPVRQHWSAARPCSAPARPTPPWCASRTMKRALAMTTDCTPRYCLADPEEGGKQAVAEAWRNITAVGALPLAITDNMNFGNPEKPRDHGPVRRRRARHGRGLHRARLPGRERQRLALQRDRGPGDPADPRDRRRRRAGGCGARRSASRCRPGLDLVLVGETAGWLGQSLWLREIAGREEGAPPPVDLAAERRNGDFVRGADPGRRGAACHDCADGGLLVAVAEMAMAAGIGATLAAAPAGVPAHAFWFGEDQGRYVLAVADAAPHRWPRRRPPACRPRGSAGRGGGDLVLARRPVHIGGCAAGPPMRRPCPR